MSNQISLESVRQCVDDKCCVPDSTGVSAIIVLRELRASGNLHGRSEARLVQIEQGIQDASTLLFHTLSAALESQHPTLDHDRIKAGLDKHQDDTLDNLAVALLSDCPHCREVKAKLRRGGAHRQAALSALSAEMLNASSDADSLTEVTDVLTRDPKNSLLRDFFRTAVDTINNLKDFALSLFRDVVRERETFNNPAIVDSLTRGRGTGDGGEEFLFRRFGGSEENPLARTAQEIGRVVEHAATEKKIEELRDKIAQLTEQIVRTHRLAVEGPPELQYAAGIECNRDMVEKTRAEAQLADAQRNEKYFDA